MYFAKTYFSFKYGTLSTEELVTAGVEAGIPALALTNINSTCDAWYFVLYCEQQRIKPILGVEIRQDGTLLYILLAANNNGFRRINDFLSVHLLEKKPFPAGETSPLFSDTTDGFVIYPLGNKAPEALQQHERIGVLPGEVNKLLRLPLASCPDKWIIRQPVTFRNKTYYNLHRLLRAVDKNTLLSKLKPEDLAGEQEYFIPPADVLTAFRQYPFIITNTYRLFDACSISMRFGQDKNKKRYSASREDDRVLLEKLAKDGFRQRYGTNKKVKERLNKELRI